MYKKVHLGDGAYAEFDGFGIKLSADRNFVEHWIYLEPETIKNLNMYLGKIYNCKITVEKINEIDNDKSNNGPDM